MHCGVQNPDLNPVSHACILYLEILFGDLLPKWGAGWGQDLPL